MTIFTDLDGPILDISERYFRVYAELVRELGGSTGLNKETFWRLRRSGRSSHSLLAAENPAMADKSETFRRRWVEEIETAPALLKLDVLQPHAAETLQWLAARYPLVLVTLRQNRGALIEELTRQGILGFFRAVRSGDPEGGQGWETKRRLILESGFKTVGVMIGDTEVDIRAGKLTGLGTIAVADGIRDEIFLRKEAPDLLVQNLASLRDVDLTALANANLAQKP